MSLSFDFEGCILCVTIDGGFSFEEAEQMRVDVLSDPNFVKGMRLLIDARKARGNPSSNKTRERAAYLASVSENISPGIALVVSKPLYYGLGRMFQIFASLYKVKIEIFMDIHEARQYLERGEKNTG